MERILSAAVLLYGVVMSLPAPARHHDILAKIRPLYLSPIGGDMQGFLTTTGRFVSRREAVAIATAAGQIDEPKFQPNALFSEDLW